MNRKVFSILGAAIVLAIALLVIVFNRNATAPTQEKSSAPPSSSVSQKGDGNTFQQTSFTNIKSPHYVSSEPSNNALLTSSPNQVVIRFNFDVAPPSKISVTRDGTNVVTGTTSISSDKLNLSVPIEGSKTGNYEVKYTACWPDRSCHEGSFGFSVKLP